MPIKSIPFYATIDYVKVFSIVLLKGTLKSTLHPLLDFGSKGETRFI